MEKMDLILKTLAYYGWYQSYLDPLGKPCICVSCDQGSKALHALDVLAEMELYDQHNPLDEDFPLVTIRAILEFYATGAGYNNESVPYGEKGKLAQYGFDVLEIDITPYQVVELWSEFRDLELK